MNLIQVLHNHLNFNPPNLFLMKTLSIYLVALFLLCFHLSSCDKDNVQPDPDAELYMSKGTDTPEIKELLLPGTSVRKQGSTMTVSLYDRKSGEQLVGKLTDLTENTVPLPDGSGVESELYSIFEFDDAEQSTLTMHNFLKIVEQDEITMKASITDPGKSTIVAGTGRFEGAGGYALLDATVDLSQADKGLVSLVCLYDVYFDE